MVELVTVCPEVEHLGLSIPRSPLRQVLVNREGLDKDQPTTHNDQLTIELWSTESNQPVPEALTTIRRSIQSRSETDPQWDLSTLDGFIGKAHSPTCGVMDARLYFPLLTSAEQAELVESEAARSEQKFRTWRKKDPLDGRFTNELRKIYAAQDIGKGQAFPCVSSRQLNTLGKMETFLLNALRWRCFKRL